VHGSVGAGAFVVSTASAVAPAPSQTRAWQSAGTSRWTSVPRGAGAVPHRPASHVATMQGDAVGSQSAARPHPRPVEVAPPAASPAETMVVPEASVALAQSPASHVPVSSSTIDLPPHAATRRATASVASPERGMATMLPERSVAGAPPRTDRTFRASDACALPMFAGD
jgi:hypothetical protein